MNDHLPTRHGGYADRTDGWTPEWRRWFAAGPKPERERRRRIELIRRTVRAALEQLHTAERASVELYFYDGLSFGQIADSLGVSLNRVRTLHRRAFTNLERILTPFVRATFGLTAIRETACPICCAVWRTLAEELLDEKTPEVTWGQIARRLERAVGWRPTAAADILFEPVTEEDS